MHVKNYLFKYTQQTNLRKNVVNFVVKQKCGTLWIATKNAKLRAGMKEKITPEQYKQMVEDDTITEAIAEYKVKEGDCFFLPAGRIHSIGTGCFLAEIQQTSDVTYESTTLNVRIKTETIVSYTPKKLQNVSIIT